MKILLNIIKYIIIILLTFCIIGLIVINVASSTILKKQYVLGELEKTNYYEIMQDGVQSKFEEYIQQSGLDQDVIKDIVSVEKIKEDTNIIIDNIYEGTNTDIDTEILRTNLKNKIDNSLNNIKLTTEQQKSIEKFIDIIEEQYINTILHTKYENDINDVITKVNNIVGKANIMVIVGTAVCVILLFAVNFKNLIQGLSNIGIAFVSSGIFYVFLKIYITSKIKFANFTVLNDTFSNSARSIINTVLNNIILYGSILAVLGIIFIFVGNIKKDKKRAKHN